MDDPRIVHDVNVLTVIANESYKDFVGALQKEIADTLSDRPKKADAKYFIGKIIGVKDGANVLIDERQAKRIERYLIKNDYVDLDGHISDKYYIAKEEGSIVPLPEELRPIAEQVFVLIDSVYSDAMLPTFEDEYQQKPNPLNNNLKKKEFIALWEHINQKAVYTVHFDSEELIDNATNALNKELTVRALQYQVVEGEMAGDISDDDIKGGEAFQAKDSSTISGGISVHSGVEYDLIGKLASETKLTRKTIGAILQKVHDKTFDMYRKNPEEFIRNAGRIINEQKATTVIEHLSYDKTEEKHHLEDIFTLDSKRYDVHRLKEVNKHVYDYLLTDSKTEKAFAESLDVSSEVVVYAKLPRSFFIPTPVGEYNPDWAIAFDEGKVKHIYFVAETKGDMSTMQLRGIEKVKTECAKKFFSKITSDKVKYDVVDSYNRLMELVN
jgi:type III restriction enzyme